MRVRVWVANLVRHGTQQVVAVFGPRVSEETLDQAGWSCSCGKDGRGDCGGVANMKNQGIEYKSVGDGGRQWLNGSARAEGIQDCHDVVGCNVLAAKALVHGGLDASVVQDLVEIAKNMWFLPNLLKSVDLQAWSEWVWQFLERGWVGAVEDVLQLKETGRHARI